MFEQLLAARKDFLALNQVINEYPLAYLDSAATTLKPAIVADTMRQHYAFEASNIHRGVHFLSEQATTKYELVRKKIQNFLNARSSKEIIFTSGTTGAINLVARSFGDEFLKAGDEIVITYMEHHSNIVPWQMLCQRVGCKLKVVPIDDTGEMIWEEFDRLVTERTKLISVVYVSNSLGTINPVKDMTTLAHARGAKVLVDAAQAGAHLSIDVQALNCDFLAMSAHKLLGPTGVGVLYGKEALLNAMPPFLGGGDMIRSVTFEGSTYADLPAKFEAGTPNIAGVIGMGAGIEYLEKLGFENIAAYEQDLLAYATEAVGSLPGIRLIGNAKHKASILSFVVNDIHPHDIGSIADSFGVAIRTGHHCCQPVMQRFGVPATARASLAFYNSRSDIDQLVIAIKKAQEIFA